MKRFVAGIHSLQECLKVRPRSIQSVWMKKNYEKHSELKDLAQKIKGIGVSINTVSVEYLEGRCSGHQGVLAQVNSAPEINWDNLYAKKQSLVLALDGIEDPHNFGALLRTAWLLGVDGVVAPQDRSCNILNPTVNKVASGGVEHLPVETVTNLSRTLADLKEQSYWVYGLAEEGKQGLWDLKLSGHIVIVVGNESNGIRPGVKKQCDELVRIFQVSTGSSFNASVAGALALGEARRQMPLHSS